MTGMDPRVDDTVWIVHRDDPNYDPEPGEAETPWDEMARLRAKVRRLERKAAAANRARRDEMARHAADVAHVFNVILSAELEGRPVPVTTMPDITKLHVESASGGMGWRPNGVKDWIEARR